MPPDESLYPRDWLRLAERDFGRVHRLLAGGDPELAGFCLQQAVEKYLKASLLARGWHLRRIHNLEALLDDAVIYDPALEQFRAACQMITNYYMVERYPLTAVASITESEVNQSLVAVIGLVEHIRDSLA